MAAVATGSLLAMLAEIPDPRQRQGRRFQLVAMLAAMVGGILSGHRGYTAIAQWLRAQEPRFWHKLGFTRKPPCVNTFRDLLLLLPPEQLESTLRKWMAGILDQPRLTIALGRGNLSVDDVAHAIPLSSCRTDHFPRWPKPPSPVCHSANSRPRSCFGTGRLDVYWCLGSFDGLLMFEAADSQSATSAMLSLVAQGNVQTQTA